ncbi:MAG: ABC transporter permease subunit [Actinobacteria bacterium]|nr:MAG: ABC transporter permease subunit [Actinomycetota bacterium]
MPRPSAIWGQFHGNFRQIRKATTVTGTNAFIGLLLGISFGSITAFVASRFKALSELITPMAIAVSAMPIIVLVAIFNDLFAITSEIPRRLMVAVVVFFLVFINVSRGLTQADATQLELMRSYGASESAIIRKVRVPNALSFFFVALRQAAPLAVVTAFVSEYFGGLQNGLGSRISQAIANSKDAAGWAYVSGACLLGLVFFVLSIALERLVMPWKARRSSR